MTSPEGVIDLEGHGCHLVRAKQKRRPASLSGRGDICGQLVLSASLILLLGGGGGHAPSLLAKAEIFQYDNMEMKNPLLVYREAGMFSPRSFFLEPGAEGGNGESFIRLVELKFEAEGLESCSDPRSDACRPQGGFVDLAIFEQESFEDIGIVVDHTRFYCCDEVAQTSGACRAQDEGRLLFTEDETRVRWRRRLELYPGQSSSLEMNDVFHVSETGMYVVLMANCDSRNGVLYINGHTEWMNPYGYLPGEVYGCLPFFFFLAVFYLVLGVVWMVLCMTYIKDLLAIQMWASIVLLLGMVETAGQYFDYRSWNMSGSRSHGVQSFAILFGSAKRALSLSLILMVCMGYGIVRPSLGRDLHRIMGLALVYFITSSLWAALNDYRQSDKNFSNRSVVDYSTMLVFMNSIIMVVFYGWILQSIFGVIHHLHLRRQTAKLQLYERFRMVLAASVVFAILWAVYGVVRSTERETNRNWESYWTVNAIWEVLYLAILLAVCHLLRPSMNTQRFAFSELPTSDDDKGGEYGDILLQSMGAEDAEYGGPLDGDVGKTDEYMAPESAATKGKVLRKVAP